MYRPLNYNGWRKSDMAALPSALVKGRLEKLHGSRARPSQGVSLYSWARKARDVCMGSVFHGSGTTSKYLRNALRQWTTQVLHSASLQDRLDLHVPDGALAERQSYPAKSLRERNAGMQLALWGEKVTEILVRMCRTAAFQVKQRAVAVNLHSFPYKPLGKPSPRSHLA